MAYALRSDGLADVHLPDGTVMPMALSPQQLQAMGHSEISANAVRPPSSPLAVAGPGGGDPRDLSGGAGIFGVPRTPQEENTAQLRELLSRAPQSHESRPAIPTKFDVPIPAERGGPGLDLAPHSSPRANAEQPSGNGELTLTPAEEMAFREAARGGGAAKPGLTLGKRSEKYTTYGAVPAELSADINRRGDELEKTQAANLSEHHAATEQLLARRDAQYEQQMNDVIDQRVQRMAINDRLQQLQTTRDQREQEVATMPPPDLHRYWGEKGVASQIATGLAIAIGGYVQGLRGGENPGLKMVDDSIDRWMQTEREKYEREKDTAARANNQYGQALALYGTPEMAENDMRARAYAVRDAMLANQLDQIGNADAYAKGQEMLQQGALQRQQLKAQAFQLAGEKAVEDTLQQRQTGGGGFLRGMKAAVEAKRADDELTGKVDRNGKPIRGAANGPLVVRFGDGALRQAGSSREKTAAQKSVSGAQEAIKVVDRLLQKSKEASSRAPGSDERAELSPLVAALTIHSHDAFGIQTFQGPTAELMHQLIGNPEAFLRNPGAAAQLREVRRTMQDELQKQKEALAPVGAGAGAGDGAEEPDNDLPDSAQEVVE